MELYGDILVKALEKGMVEVKFPQINLADLVESESYKLLQKIYDIMRDVNKTDEDCFEAIEEIVCAFEDAGISCGCRHDF